MFAFMMLDVCDFESWAEGLDGLILGEGVMMGRRKRGLGRGDGRQSYVDSWGVQVTSACSDASIVWDRDKPGLTLHEQSEFVIRGHR